MHIATLLLVSTLVLRSGHPIEVDANWHEENGRILFRAGGTLYSVPVAEVDLEATRAIAAPALVAAKDHMKLKVGEEERKRLIQDLEQNHAGRPAPPEQTTIMVPPAPTGEGAGAPQEDEWTWRNRAREHEERIRQARENRDLLATRAEQLRSHIAGLISLGYKPGQFSYDSTLLQSTIEQIPYADLEIQRAERAYAQFRDDARRMAITPGWLR
jgi:hypothetical protein